MKKTIKKNKFLKIFIPLLLVAVFSVGLFFKPKTVNANTNDVTNLYNYYQTYYTNDYFENAFNYRFKGSNANYSWFIPDNRGNINFGIGNYTYKDDYLSYGHYELYDGNGSGNGMDKIAQYQRSLSNFNTPQTTFYTNAFSESLTITFTNIVIPFDNRSYENFDGMSAEIFANAVNDWFSNLYLYANIKDISPTYSFSYSLNAYNDLDNENDSYNVHGDYITLTTQSDQFKSLDHIITVAYLYQSFNAFIDALPNERYQVMLPCFDLTEISSATFNGYNHYFILPNAKLSITLPDELKSVFYFVETMIDGYYIYDNNFIEFLNLFANGELVPDNTNAIYQMGYFDGYYIGYGDGEDYGYSTGYELGYNYGFNDGYNNALGYGGVFDVVFSGLESFLNLEIFPDFKVYYIILFGFGLTLFSLLLKYAFGG